MKKIISIMLALAMMVTFIIPAMANSNVTEEAVPIKATDSISVDKAMEKAIKAAKTKLAIPEDCKKFSYNIYEQNGLKVWYLSWSNEETQKYVSVTIDENNFISSYSTYQYMSYNNGKQIPKYSKEQGQKIAEQFINNLEPNLLKQYKLVENNTYNSDRDYYFSYVRQVNGISYFNNIISINVNNISGQVTNYNCGYSKTTKFEDASKIIGLDKAQKAFAEKLGLKLVYNIKSENNKPVTYLAYVPKDPYKYIDAVTGEVETLSNRYGIYDTAVAYSEKSSMDAAANVVLTPEELDAVKDMSNLISKEDVDKKIRSISLFKLDSEYKLVSAELRKDWRNENSLVWSLQYRKEIDATTKQNRDVQVTANAKTGEIKEFWTYYSSPEGTKPQKTKDQAKAISDEALKVLVPNTYAKLKFDDSYSGYVYEDGTQSNYSFRYVRIENGIECPSDYVTISYDNLSGNISGMYSNWTDNLKFDNPKKAIPVEEANKVLFDKIGYDIQYVDDYNQNATDKMIYPERGSAENAILGYFFDNYKPKIISAITGDVLDYNGEVYKEYKVTDYTDIDGLAAEDKIKILTQLNIRYNEEQLKPNDNLVQKDYFLILSRLTDTVYIEPGQDEDKAIERMYNELINQGIITKGEKAPMSTLTREEAAKYFVRFLKLGQVADIKSIFKVDFKDADKINPDLVGYVAITSGLKAMNGSNGNFMPKKKITRLEGLLTIYNYLSAK